MTPDTWTAVERYLVDLLAPPDAALEAALADIDAAGLPAISVAPNEGKLLHLLATIVGARRILEIGTLGGYSAIWLARALPTDGRLITLEVDETHAAVARANIARAGLADRVEIVIGPALDSLPKLAGPFDLIFIDADKENNPHYLQWALKLSRPGSLIVIDNVVRSRKVVDSKSKDKNVRGARAVLEMLAAEPRVTSTALQTVGSKGYDGFAIALVRELRSARRPGL